MVKPPTVTIARSEACEVMVHERRNIVLFPKETQGLAPGFAPLYFDWLCTAIYHLIRLKTSFFTYLDTQFARPVDARTDLFGGHFAC